jgi:superfamily II DNA or RNA helicase
MTLRDDQEVALQALRDAVAQGKRRIMMQAPTGYGKTMLASAVVNNARAKDKRILFTVPAISLIDQTIEMFAKQGIWDVGVIQATHNMTDWNQPIQICSIQSLMKRTIPKADVVLLDEAHRWFRFYERWLAPSIMPDWANVPFIGLSATPWTKGLGAWFDHFHRAATIQDMIDAGNLSPFKVYAPSHPDLSNVRTVGGDYHEGELSDLMSEKRLVADIVETWLKLGRGRPTLCYCVDRAHAKKVQAQFIAAGVRCGYQDHLTGDQSKRSKKTGQWIEGRESVKRKFHNGEYEVVCNVETLTTGVDWDVRCISMCRPTKSDMLFCQIVGRGLRIAPNKDDCLILDHSDNHLRLGFVTDVDASYTGLHDGKSPTHENRTSAIRLPKECPGCGYLKAPKMAQCPACKFVAQRVSKIEPEAGELRELKPKPKRPMSDGAYLTHNEKAMFYAELKGYAYQHNYKEGWAANKYRERIGTWPANDMKYIQMLAPKPSTASWIKSRAIAWAKSKARNYGQQDDRTS